MSRSEKKVYLTFDDGPVPIVTPWVLETLAHYGVKASFFCVGENVKNNPDIYSKILKEGHAVGNHTYNHLKGFSTKNTDYFENVKKCREFIQSNLFRPPYGQLKKTQQTFLAKAYKLIMWDVISHDYSSAISPEKCLENVTKNARNGSIIVFHDSAKAFRNLEYTLPRAIMYLKENNFKFGVL
jgi:peptidoglycan/xylan/chitin deacetylase (PgdA/CDA1 family)